LCINPSRGEVIITNIRISGEVALGWLDEGRNRSPFGKGLI